MASVARWAEGFPTPNQSVEGGSMQPEGRSDYEALEECYVSSFWVIG